MPAQEVEITIVDAGELYAFTRDFVATQLTAAGDPPDAVAVVFGRRELAKQTNQGSARASRIVFVPGDEGGASGRMAPPLYAQSYPRIIATYVETLSIHIWGHDASAPTDELAQYREVQRLHGLVLNALRRSSAGRYEVVDTTWVITPVERIYGAALTLTVELQVPILDATQAALPKLPGDVAFTASMVFPDGDVAGCSHEPIPDPPEEEDP